TQSAHRHRPPTEPTHHPATPRAMRVTPTRTPDLRPIPVIGQPPAPPAIVEDAQSARRFNLIMDRVAQSGAQPDTQAVAQLLTLAAARSQTGGQLEAYLEQLRPLTGGKEGNIFVILGGALPGWDPGV